MKPSAAGQPHLKDTAIAAAQQQRVFGSHNLTRVSSSMTCSISWPHGCPQKFELKFLSPTAAICITMQ